jgi:hypothetical protein
MARPPRLPDSTILELINELRGQHAALTGIQVRNELRRRHGAPCGVTRVYRLLHSATTAPVRVPSPPAPTSTRNGSDLQAELTAALERARLAEHREEAHQARWASEIHELREQVRTFKEAARRLPVLEAELQDRSRLLAAAYKRIADLESQPR